jgi:hypothetical protein
VGLSVALLLLALLAIRRALAAPRPRASASWAAAAGASIFLGLWTKLVFAWWLPIVAVFALEDARRQGLSLGGLVKGRRAALLAGAVALVVPTVLLLASLDRDGRPYVEALRQGGLSTEPEDVEAVAVRLSAYVTDGSLLAPRNVLLGSSVLDVLPLVVSVGLLALALARPARRREIATWALLAAATFAFVAASGHSRWPHHFAFPLLPLVLALAIALDTLGARARLAAAALVVAFWASIGFRLGTARVPGESAPDKDRLLAFVRERGLDRRTLQVHASWGTYYVAQLFGDPERMLVYTRRIVDDPERLSQMADLAREKGRPVLLVSSRRWERLHTPAVEAAFGTPQHTWQFGPWWAVEYQPPRRE